jgi:predicted DNA-binding transcriptional regulator YafY
VNDLASVPVQQENSRYWINPTDYISSVRVNVGESLMLYLAMRRAIRQMSYVPPVMINALEKMAVPLRHPANLMLAATTNRLQTDQPVDRDRAQVWENMIRAWVEGITVCITYQSHRRDEPRTYEFQPYLFEPVLLSEGVYVVGYSLTHQGLRTFKVERIQKATLTTHHFERDETIDADTLVQHAWGIWYGENLTEVRLRFSAQVARRVKETIWHPTQQIDDLPDGRVEWSVLIAGVQELVPWIRGWGPDVEVIEPPDLRRQIAEDVRRAAELYAASSERQ